MIKALIAAGTAILAALGVVVYVERRKLVSTGQAIVDEMKDLTGTLYRWGGKDPSKGGLDCSGAVTYVLQRLGLAPKGYVKSADELYRESIKVIFPQPGDLAFYGTTGHVSHVMVVAGDGKVVGATGGGPSTTSDEIAKKQNAMVKMEPQDYRKDLVAFGRLPMTAGGAA